MGCMVMALWGINYIAAEIESPFGKDANDLDLTEMALDMNDSLFMLSYTKQVLAVALLNNH